MLKLFANISVVLEQIPVFKLIITAELALQDSWQMHKK